MRCASVCLVGNTSHHQTTRTRCQLTPPHTTRSGIQQGWKPTIKDRSMFDNMQRKYPFFSSLFFARRKRKRDKGPNNTANMASVLAVAIVCRIPPSVACLQFRRDRYTCLVTFNSRFSRTTACCRSCSAIASSICAISPSSMSSWLTVRTFSPLSPVGATACLIKDPFTLKLDFGLQTVEVV